MSSKGFLFGRLPIHVLTEIAHHLAFRDLLNLRAVCRLLRHQMAGIWPTVLSYPDICSTTNLLSIINADANNDCVSMWLNNHAQCRLSVTQFRMVIAKCGLHLRELNFAFCRRERENALENVACSLKGCVRVDEGIWKALEQCPKLELLDLSAVRIRSKDLITIGRCVGRTLKAIEFIRRNAESLDGHPTDMDDIQLDYHPTDMDVDCFSQLLQFCIQLESLSVSMFFTQPQFSYREVAPTLRKIKARELNGAQLAEVLARTGGCLQDLRTSIMGGYEPAKQQVNQQQLDHFFGGLKCLKTLSIEKDTERQPLEFIFSPLVCNSLIRLEGIHIGNIDQQRVQLMDSLFKNKLTALQQLCISCANFSPRPFADFVCGGGLQNLTSLTVMSCSSIDDGLLELVAAQGRLEELRLLTCPNVTVEGFAVFLPKCKKIRLFCGDEQLCDTLLELVFDTMDERMQGRMPNDIDADVVGPSAYAALSFEFLRLSRQEPYIFVSWPSVDWHNEASVRSSSQNLHPWVSFHTHNSLRASGLFS